MKNFLYVILFYLAICSVAQACDCVMTHPDGDAYILKQVDAIGRFEVLARGTADWSKPSSGDVVSTLRLLTLYYGSLEPDKQETIFVKSNFSHGCSIYPEVGKVQDFILLLRDGEYWFADMCTYLSAEGWAKLKGDPLKFE